jgi:hypothetical protein
MAEIVDEFLETFGDLHSNCRSGRGRRQCSLL